MKDAVSLLSGVQKLCRLVRGWKQEAHCSRSKILGKRDGSKFRRPTGSVSTKSLVTQRVELAGVYIGLELTIPDLRIKCDIPAAKRRQLFWRELLNLLFD